MKILVTFALGAEFAPWRRLRDFVPVKFGDSAFYRTQAGNAEVAVFLTGAGAKVMGLFMDLLAAGPGFDVCISSGLAGALRPEHLPGEVLAARSVCRPVARADLASERIRCDSDLLEGAGQCGAKIVEQFYTSDRIVAATREKARLGEFADAVEMESFDILREAGAWGTRAVAVRAVSDALDHDLPLDFNRVLTPRGEVSIARILGEVARTPRSLPALLRFGRQSRRAAEHLVRFLDVYVEALSRKISPRELDTPVAAT